MMSPRTSTIETAVRRTSSLRQTDRLQAIHSRPCSFQCNLSTSWQQRHSAPLGIFSYFPQVHQSKFSYPVCYVHAISCLIFASLLSPSESVLEGYTVAPCSGSKLCQLSLPKLCQLSLPLLVLSSPLKRRELCTELWKCTGTHESTRSWISY